jgi:hypothetical protein
VGRAGGWDGRRAGVGLEREPVAAAGQGGNGLGAQELPQRRDLHLEVVLLDHDARPDERQQLVLAHDARAVLDQCDQQVERARPERRRRAIHQHAPLGRTHLDGAESVAPHATSPSGDGTENRGPGLAAAFRTFKGG